MCKKNTIVVFGKFNQNIFFIVIALFLLLIITVLPTPVNAVWTNIYSPGYRITSLQVYNNKLYAGTDKDGIVYVYDGISWTVSYDGSDRSIESFAVYDGKLYAGASVGQSSIGQSDRNGRVYIYDGLVWTEHLVYDSSIHDLVVYNNKIYAGIAGKICELDFTSDSAPTVIEIENPAAKANMDIATVTPVVFVDISKPTPIPTPIQQICRTIWILPGDVGRLQRSAAYNGKLYANGWEFVYVYDGASWTQSEGSPGHVNSMAVYNGTLYASGESGKIYSFNGTLWAMVYDSPANALELLAGHNGLYGDAYGKVYVFNGTSWVTTSESSVIIPYARTLYSLATYNGKVYAGTREGIYEIGSMSTPTQTPISTTSTPTQKQQCDDGCFLVDLSCAPVGTRLVSNNTPVYCNFAKKTLEPQKSDGAACQNSYECAGNYCSDGVCGNLQKELAGTRSLLEQILSFLRTFFGKFFPVAK